MAQITVKNAAGKDAGNVELDDAMFGVQPNVPLMHQVVTAQLAARRAGTQSTKTRAEVRGGGAKPYSRRAPATPARARPAPRTTAVVASPSAPSRASTTRRPRRR